MQAASSGYQLDSVLDFMRMLWSIEHGLHRVSKRMNNTLGITGGQRLVLLVVERFPGLSPKELAHLLHLHPSTITGVLQRLEGKGLLVREPDAADSRRVHLHVRAKGKEFARLRSRTVESAVTRALSRIPARELLAARRVLSSIADTLNGE
jgi:DNA-binding MarR family transcriptional regulator